MASCNSALLASGLADMTQLKLNASVDEVNDLPPSRVAVSPTRTAVIGPVLATTLMNSAAAVVGAGVGALSSPPPPVHPAANTASMETAKPLISF